MEYLFPWKSSGIIEDYFSGPCLFMALYRLYKNAYFGKGYKFLKEDFCTFELKGQIEKLPLDVKRIIFSKIWRKGKPYQKIYAKEEDLHIHPSLHYLLGQHGKLRTYSCVEIPSGYAGWHGTRLDRKLYVFNYGPVNPRLTPLIPDFVSREEKHPMSISFGLLCL